MKNIIAVLIFAVVVIFSAVPQHAEEFKNYELDINGAVYELNIGEDIRVTTPGGVELNILLRKKPFVIYADEFVAFQHRSDLNITTTALDMGITQILMNTASGTGIMVQEYTGLDPAMLVPMMLREVTKENIEYGYTMEKEELEYETADGKVLSGLKATLNYMSEEMYYEIMAYSGRDTGILVITMIDKEFAATEKEILTRFWETLSIKL